MYDLSVIGRGVRGIFAREFITRQRKAKYTQFCTVVDSDKSEEKYAMISTLPQLTELVDERNLAGFTDYSYTIQNKVYATGLRIPRKLFEYDQTGQIRTLVQSLGARVANFPDKLMLTLLGQAETNLCYDGSAFFAATHNLGNGVAQNNILAGGLTNDMINATTPMAGAFTDRNNAISQFAMDLNKAKGMLLDMKDDRAEPWHDEAEPDGLMIVCHPRAEMFVRTCLEAAVVGQTSNVMVKSVGNMITSNRKEPFGYVADGTTASFGTWYLMKTNTPVQPLIFQRFGPKTKFDDAIPEADQSFVQGLASIEIQSIMRTGQDISEFTFFNDEFLFGARAHYSGGYGMWQNAIKVKAADYSSASA